MKKLLAMGLTTLVVASSSLTAMAHHEVCGVSGCSLGECFMDTDGDGICGDHFFVDENGDGICDNHCYYDGNNDGICDNFVDDNTDGICDHCHDHGKPVVISRSTTGSTTRRARGHHGSHHGCR